jgi:uncharacterized protein (DUF305 family)
MRPTVPLPIALLLLGSALAGCAPLAGQAPDEARSPAALEALYRARADSARGRFTEADVAFVTAMIGHHTQALEMAALAPSHDAGSTVRTLAARIASGQEEEISRMRQWLLDRGRPAPEVMTMDGHTMVHGPGAEHAMPGMLTPEQMAQLRSARGAAFDLAFLRFMIQHHRGAVAMVDALLATDGAARHPALFKLASDIHADQTTEIARMERVLVTLP